MRVKRPAFLMSLVAVVLLVFLATAGAASVSFPDVPTTHEFYGPISSLAEKGIISGYTTGKFGPDDPVMRAQLAKMTVIAYDHHDEAITNQTFPTFKDVDYDGQAYPYDYIEEAAKHGLIYGYSSGNFGPYDPLTRVQLVRVIIRAAGSDLDDPPADYRLSFTDVPAEDVPVVAKAKYNGLIDGKSATSFAPYAGATRGHVAKILYNALQYSVTLPEEPPQEQTIAEWDAEDLEIGYADGDYAESVTRSVTLPSSGARGSSVSWATSDGSVVSSTGAVTSPAGQSRSVTLTATVRNGIYEVTRDFVLKVVKQFTAPVLEDNTLESLAILASDRFEIFPDEDNSLGFIDGRFTSMSIESPREAIHSLNSVRTLLQISNPEQEFVWLRTSSDGEQTSYRLQQVIDNVPVYGREVVVTTDGAGNAVSLTNAYLPGLDVPMEPLFAADFGESLLATLLGPEVEFLSHELMVFALPRRTPSLAWKYRVEGADSDGDYVHGEYFVDALLGEYLAEVPLVKEGFADASGVDVLGVERTFEVYQLAFWQMVDPSRSIFEMHDTTRGVKTYDYDDGEVYTWLPGAIVGSDYNIWSDTAAVSAHANLAQTYDYYRDVLDRDSIDDQGMAIVSSVHVLSQGRAMDNAYWDGRQIAFGDGDTRFIELSAGLDVAAHEFTHGVVQHTAGLVYENGSGALDESYADILGNLVEGDDDDEWLIGEDVMAPGNTQRALRNMSAPGEFFNPSALEGDFYISPSNRPSSMNDYGGVHTNSGILNHAAFLMWDNGITNKSVLARLWYKSLLKLTSTSGYYDAKAAVISAANDMHFSDSFMNIVRTAFDSVNVTEPKTVSLTGQVVVADGDTDSSNNEALGDVSIEVAKMNTSFTRTLSTDSGGTYEIGDLFGGAYVVIASKTGYLTETQVVTLSAEEAVNRALTIELIPEAFAGLGSAAGMIVDAETGQGVANLTLLLRRGINDVSSEIVDFYNTDADGRYVTYDVPAGNYCVQILDDRDVSANERYLSSSTNIKILGGLTIDEQNASVTKTLGASQMRIILQWGASPEDLDAHLEGPTLDGGGFHVSWENTTYLEGGILVAELDVDDIESYGPETITLHNTIPGTYKFYVHNYSEDPAMSTSSATVKVFMGAGSSPLFSATVPSAPGLMWDVFEYDGATGEITSINAMR